MVQDLAVNKSGRDNNNIIEPPWSCPSGGKVECAGLPGPPRVAPSPPVNGATAFDLNGFKKRNPVAMSGQIRYGYPSIFFEDSDGRFKQFMKSKLQVGQRIFIHLLGDINKGMKKPGLSMTPPFKSDNEHCKKTALLFTKQYTRQRDYAVTCYSRYYYWREAPDVPDGRCMRTQGNSSQPRPCIQAPEADLHILVRPTADTKYMEATAPGQTTQKGDSWDRRCCCKSDGKTCKFKYTFQSKGCKTGWFGGFFAKFDKPGAMNLCTLGVDEIEPAPELSSAVRRTLV